MSMNLLGISLSNVGLREALRRTEEYFRGGGLNTIAYVSASKLVQASEQEEQKAWLEDLDLTICEDVEVLKAAGITSQNRIREVEENQYLQEILKLIVRNYYKVFLLADTEENLQEFEEELRFLQSNLPVAGRDATENYSQDKSSMINGINAVAPQIILSRFSYPEGIQLMHDYHRLLNGAVWLTLPEKLFQGRKETLLKKASGFFYRQIFHKKVNHFKEEPQSK